MWYQGGKHRGAKLRELEREAGNVVLGDNIYHAGDAVKSLDGTLKTGDVTPSLERDLFAVPRWQGTLSQAQFVPLAVSATLPSTIAGSAGWRGLVRGKAEPGCLLNFHPHPALETSPQQSARMSARTQMREIPSICYPSR